jgi:RimJ/RimL family protein N-acetyltransferase
MAFVRETATEDWPALREIRLAALQDAPDAFASTYAREETLDETAWRARIARGGSFLAYVPEISASEPVGLVGGYDTEPGTVGLISMWVRPQARGHGVGEALIAAVLDWAQARHLRSVHLWVTDNNKAARRLYERCGFKPTGERQPLPSNPALGELAMARQL